MVTILLLTIRHVTNASQLGCVIAQTLFQSNDSTGAQLLTARRWITAGKWQIHTSLEVWPMAIPELGPPRVSQRLGERKSIIFDMSR